VVVAAIEPHAAAPRLLDGDARLYTQEAFAAYLRHLGDDGMRSSQLLPDFLDCLGVRAGGRVEPTPVFLEGSSKHLYQRWDIFVCRFS
ncbi:MAG: hypothetical protein HYR94_11905, partial [Chloroflexi bacterium]|nr:hypothetical protein [Chloroflexota bacterium]